MRHSVHSSSNDDSFNKQMLQANCSMCNISKNQIHMTRVYARTYCCRGHSVELLPKFSMYQPHAKQLSLYTYTSSDWIWTMELLIQYSVLNYLIWKRKPDTNHTKCKSILIVSVPQFHVNAVTNLSLKNMADEFPKRQLYKQNECNFIRRKIIYTQVIR